MTAGPVPQNTPLSFFDVTREDRRSLFLHEAVAARLEAESDAVIARARRNLDMVVSRSA